MEQICQMINVYVCVYELRLIDFSTIFSEKIF